MTQGELYAERPKEPKEGTQKAKILTLLRARSRVSSVELNEVCFRYSARVHDLRQDGHRIESRPSTSRPGVWYFELWG